VWCVVCWCCRFQKQHYPLASGRHHAVDWCSAATQRLCYCATEVSFGLAFCASTAVLLQVEPTALGRYLLASSSSSNLSPLGLCTGLRISHVFKQCLCLPSYWCPCAGHCQLPWAWLSNISREPALGLLTVSLFRVPPQSAAAGLVLMACVSGAQLSSYATSLAKGSVRSVWCSPASAPWPRSSSPLSSPSSSLELAHSSGPYRHGQVYHAGTAHTTKPKHRMIQS